MFPIFIAYWLFCAKVFNMHFRLFHSVVGNNASASIIVFDSVIRTIAMLQECLFHLMNTDTWQAATDPQTTSIIITGDLELLKYRCNCKLYEVEIYS